LLGVAHAYDEAWVIHGSAGGGRTHDVAQIGHLHSPQALGEWQRNEDPAAIKARQPCPGVGLDNAHDAQALLAPQDCEAKTEVRRDLAAVRPGGRTLRRLEWLPFSVAQQELLAHERGRLANQLAGEVHLQNGLVRLRPREESPPNAFECIAPARRSWHRRHRREVFAAGVLYLGDEANLRINFGHVGQPHDLLARRVVERADLSASGAGLWCGAPQGAQVLARGHKNFVEQARARQAFAG
jgi:hypothetical protein